jgi:hypothetical protein
MEADMSEGPVIDNPRQKQIERPGGTDAPGYSPLPEPPPGDKSIEQAGIHREQQEYERGFEVGGHDGGIEY